MNEEELEHAREVYYIIQRAMIEAHFTRMFFERLIHQARLVYDDGLPTGIMFGEDR